MKLSRASSRKIENISYQPRTQSPAPLLIFPQSAAQQEKTAIWYTNDKEIEGEECVGSRL